jgi:RimJ/RimL family protein N-acetyltransferase
MPWAQQPATLEGQLDWFRTSSAGWEAGHDFPYGVFLRGDVVGGTGFHVRNGPGVLEIGYWLSAAYEGRGIMSRVVRRLTEVARDIPGVTRLEIHCDAGNARSRAVAQRLGYRLDRTARVEPAAPGETGRHEFWTLDLDRPTRTPPR